MDDSKHSKLVWVTIILFPIFTVGFILEGYTLFILYNRVNVQGEKLVVANETLRSLASSTDAYITETEQRLVSLSDVLYEDQQNIEGIQDIVRGFDKQVDRLSGTVDTLEKLTTTDPELLQKYSRIYFLNEHYKPADLSIIDQQFDLPNGKEVTVNADVYPFLDDLLNEAKDDGVDIMVLSGYRSYIEQTTLKSTYQVTYGSGANQFSADQGYSEHQLGTTVDFTNSIIGEDLSQFENSEAFQWLTKNAYKYGFVMSYPKDNAFYVYEPWHWRFVGQKLAKYLYREDKNFYDLEQREIDTYVPTLFD